MHAFCISSRIGGLVNAGVPERPRIAKGSPKKRRIAINFEPGKLPEFSRI
jgi:hypothetical protein